jgi:SAM-dependent methyltransferase
MADAAVEFICNICGAENRCPQQQLEREKPSCAGCGSSVRTRAIMQMLSRELFGMDMPLPELPRLKSVRGIGFSDSIDYAERLATKFDYRNTYYHKEPHFDITSMPEHEAGAYDFVISSEVFEHVPPPAEVAFQNVFRLLKPTGVFLMTVPYTLEHDTAEHFPELYDYGLAELSDRTVLVNRTRTGDLQVFENLVFHGGGGSTLEMRRFTERDLRSLLTGAGFSSMEIYGANYRPFGIVRTENWSLPIAARKQPISVGVAYLRELMDQWTEWIRRVRRLEVKLRSLEAEFEEYVRWATTRIGETEADVKERTEWAQRLEGELKDRTDWALSLEKEMTSHVEIARRLQAESDERTKWAMDLQREIDELRAQLTRVRGALWTKAGRVLGLVK